MNKDSASKSDVEQIENRKFFSEGLGPLFLSENKKVLTVTLRYGL